MRELIGEYLETILELAMVIMFTETVFVIMKMIFAI